MPLYNRSSAKLLYPLYKGIGGIRPDEAQPGFKHVLLNPQMADGLDVLEASHIGPYGKIMVNWRRERGRIKCEVSIPANSTASFKLPGKRKVTLNGKAVEGESINYLLGCTS